MEENPYQAASASDVSHRKHSGVWLSSCLLFTFAFILALPSFFVAAAWTIGQDEFPLVALELGELHIDVETATQFLTHASIVFSCFGFLTTIFASKAIIKDFLRRYELRKGKSTKCTNHSVRETRECHEGEKRLEEDKAKKE